ncbi:MAG: amylo-alpha-1,6-glucosidase [Nitrococcus sp.]|nr:amylo-alpha-1,6-glucosidase [Nitrococcus sp.]
MELTREESHDERLACEWLEADGLGGFASGTVCGMRTRRYHALLLAATTPPTGRIVLVNGIEAWLETAVGHFALSAQRYTPDVVYPDGAQRLVDFHPEPWPRWTFRAADGTELTQEIVARHGYPETALRWRVLKGAAPVRLSVRLLLSGRDYHALHHENPAFGFEPEIAGACVTWHPYQGLPALTVLANGRYRHEPTWYRNFLYQAERERGLDFIEDLAAPGHFVFDLASDAASLVLSAGVIASSSDPVSYVRRLFDDEARRRAQFATPLERAAAAYVVRRGRGKTIIAGYPWFTDWGRDTFIALRGFMTLPGGLDLAREILVAWADAISEGMLPNRFPDVGTAPEFNTVDASLWYVIAVHDYLHAACRQSEPGPNVQPILLAAVGQILAGYRAGTRFGIRMEADGLIAAGVSGLQLTWMDAKVGDWVVTPRIGKPVEIQALWLNALRVGRELAGEWGELFDRALTSFRQRFWNEARGCLFDVVDADHISGKNDASLRPNQILAVGGLPLQVLAEPYATRVVEVVEAKLLTPLGLRSLAPGEPGYCAHYGGGVRARDSAYHQGTVWPWLLGPFVEAWLRVRNDTPAARREADARFLAPLREHLQVAGVGHVSEVADAEPPHRPGGCPFQAWSLGELLRARRLIDEEPTSERKRSTRADGAV